MSHSKVFEPYMGDISVMRGRAELGGTAGALTYREKSPMKRCGWRGTFGEQIKLSEGIVAPLGSPKFRLRILLTMIVENECMAPASEAPPNQRRHPIVGREKIERRCCKLFRQHKIQ